jgi:CRP-like cAMP-binding protein
MPNSTDPSNLKCENCEAWGKSMLNPLCSSEIHQITESKTVLVPKKGQALFSEGGRPTGVYCIHKGKIKVYKRGFDGKEQILYICSPGDMMGYNALISEDNHTLSAKALEDSVICFIPKEDFLKGIKEVESFRQILMKTLSMQEALLAQMVTGLAQKTVKQRLAAALIMLNDTYANDAGQPGINLSREDLANVIGTATESLIRLLNDFKEEGLVAIKGRKISITNLETLRQIANIY